MLNQRSFFSELQRRHVYKVGASYAVAGWLLVQVATQVFPFFDVPNLAVRVVVLLVVAGFPIALVLAWLFDLTPQGIVRTDEVAPGADLADHAATQRGVDRKLNYLLGILLIASLGYLVLEHTVLRKTFASPDVVADSDDSSKSIAVLPFENLSDDKANAYFASGIQDEVLTQLAKIGDLKVISRTSTQHYASRPEDLPAIAKELGVANILEGSVQRAGDFVHINVQLIRAASDTHLWAEVYDRKLDNIFGVEGEVAGAIAEQLKATLSGNEQAALARKATKSPVAYEAYLKGLAATTADSSRASLESAVDYFKQAVTADPNFAEAWVEQANARYGIYSTFVHRPEDQRLIKDEIDRALSLQPDMPKALRSLARYRCDIALECEQAVEMLNKALEIEPNDAATLRVLARLNTKLGRWDQAVAQARKASELDPRNPEVWARIAQIAASLRRYDEVERALKREEEVAKDKNSVSIDFTELYLGNGDLGKAGSYLARMPFNLKDTNLYLDYSEYWRYSREYQEGIDAWTRELADTATHPPEDFVTGIIKRAEIYSCAGDLGKAKSDYEDARKRLLALRDSGATNYEIPAFLGPVDASLGLSQEALTTSRQLLSDVNKIQDYEPWARTQLAKTEMIVGDKDAAIAELETSFKEPDGISIGSLEHDCIWDPLRANPRFQKLLAKAESSDNK